MKNNTSIIESINHLVSLKVNFAVYRLPHSKEVCLIVENEKISSCGFIIQAFDFNKVPLHISKDIFLKDAEINLKNLDHLPKNNLEEKKVSFKEFHQEEYQEYVSFIITNCKNNTVRKVVSSRIESIPKPQSFDIGEYFMRLCRQYKNTFNNLYFHSDCGLWMGASPELLVKEIDENIYETYSLAGTKSIESNRNWIPKEVEEQQIVTDYIENKIKENHCQIVSNSGVETIQAGQIEHLRTTIRFQSRQRIKEISNFLHPTPAVCGLPMQTAFDTIQKKELDQRENYSGYIGIDFLEKQFYVNLRCMKITKDKLLFFIGGGITKDSIPEKEWRETQNKMKTLKNVIHTID